MEKDLTEIKTWPKSEDSLELDSDILSYGEDIEETKDITKDNRRSTFKDISNFSDVDDLDIEIDSTILSNRTSKKKKRTSDEVAGDNTTEVRKYRRYI